MLEGAGKAPGERGGMGPAPYPYCCEEGPALQPLRPDASGDFPGGPVLLRADLAGGGPAALGLNRAELRRRRGCGATGAALEAG